MIAAAALTRDPRRLAALCALWQDAERDIWITLQGASMTPTIQPGSRLRLRCRLQDAVVGEVIAYRHGGMLIVHRLVEITHDPASGVRQFVCVGDGNDRLDPPVPEEAVVGAIVEVRTPSALWRLKQGLRTCAGRCRRAAQRMPGIKAWL